MCIDLEKFAHHLRRQALPGRGLGRCGEFVRKALQAAGAELRPPYPPSGKLYGPALLALGYARLEVPNPDRFAFLKGDIMVMEPCQPCGHGHVAGYDGSHWISDFVQRDFWAGPGYRKRRPVVAVYRYPAPPCAEDEARTRPNPG
ncbi:CHAP domain-containing protein [Massilia sp. DD77]|uniref:CHAP domain-containing protein n=1 Tax=Massilia sp. DD77 TaxID=3109349 RepID=UPI0030005B0C